jgi:cytochrome c553
MVSISMLREFPVRAVVCFSFGATDATRRRSDMTKRTLTTLVLAILLAVFTGTTEQRAAAQAASPAGDQAEIAALKAEVELLKGMLPSQSHTMIDVEYHFANLWFAAKSGNWPLATFYLNETRGHLNWAVRVRSVRKLANGSELDLRPILKGIEESGLANLKTAVDKKDAAAFEPAYRDMMTQCYACHQAAEKPFLRPQIPAMPPAAIINMRP